MRNKKTYDNQLIELNSTPGIISLLKRVLAKDSQILWMSLIYSLVASLFTLAAPISVQLLINTISFTGMIKPIIVIGILLFVLLIFYSIINALQFFTTEIFQRRFFSRMTSEVGLSVLNADHKAFEEINQTDMVNRFFEVPAIQKNIPKILTNTFFLIVQTVAGLILVSFYHPFFFLFSIVLCVVIYLVWKIFYKNALSASIKESKKKYEIVSWLDDIARNQTSFKASSSSDYAKTKLNKLTGEYLYERKKHFTQLFSQALALLLIYAVASSTLLIIGGSLVVNNQLSIGQLVAAELVLSSVLYGFSKFGRDFENLYDLIASCDKLSQFQNLPNDNRSGINLEGENFEISFVDATYNYLERQYKFNLNLMADQNYLISTSGFSTKKVFIDLLQGFRSPNTGSIQINGIDLRSIDTYEWRSKITLIDNSPLMETSVREFLTYGKENVSYGEIENALKITGLERIISKSEFGLDLMMTPTGWPFSESEKIMLKIARTIIQKPKIIIIGEVFDMVVLDVRRRLLRFLTKENVTVIYFSHRIDGMNDFGHFIFLDKMEHHSLASAEKLQEFEQSQLANE